MKSSPVRVFFDFLENRFLAEKCPKTIETSVLPKIGEKNGGKPKGQIVWHIQNGFVMKSMFVSHYRLFEVGRWKFLQEMTSFSLGSFLVEILVTQKHVP